MESTTASVWVDDSHAIVRRGLAAALLDNGFRIAGESCHLEPLPDLTDVDLLVTELDARGLRQALPIAEATGTRVVVTLLENQAREIPRLLQAGVRAVLRHDDLTPALLCQTLHSVRAGATSAPSDLLLQAMNQSHVEAVVGGVLNDRERAVLRCLAQGADTLEIANELAYSERTVKSVVHDILMKLNCRTRAHAVALATRTGVI